MSKPLTPATPANTHPTADPASFTPVRLSPRRDGWTAERQRKFIEALADTGCVSEAARVAGVSAWSAYRFRRRAGAEGFDSAWASALTIATQRLASIAFERAIHGSRREIWKDGEMVAEIRQPSDRLLMFLLSHFDPMRFGKLSGILHFPVPDPCATARAALPDILAALGDCDADVEPFDTPGLEPA